MKINVHIERIVVDGLPVDRNSTPMIQEAVQAELMRLFAENSLSQSLLSSGAIPLLRMAPIQIAPQSKPNTLGHSIANTVHEGLQR